MRLRILILLILLAGCGRATPRVVLYCGQDEEFATGIIADFKQQSGVQVDVRGDTEANKSVGLYEAIVREQRTPRCDVFWNNEIVNTIRLQKQGLLAPYESPRAASYPAWTKAKDHTWQAFAGRARVLLVNNRVKPEDRPRSILELTDPKWQGRVCIAKPQFGTTATQAACLFQVLGREKAEKFYADLRPNVSILAGNKDTAIGVAEGRFDVGFTDTDDAIIEVARGRPVTIVYPDQDGLGTLVLPNTVAIVKGDPNPAQARRLVDFLLSPEVEAKLARGRSGQIPLNPEVKEQPDLHLPAQFKAMSVDFEKAAELWDVAQTFLRDRYAR
jgi:iron(III) transport system substrate-binding protein